MGDIKALLIADRAQRRDSTAGAMPPRGGELENRGPRLLTSSNDRLSDRSPDRANIYPPVSSPQEAAPWARDSGELRRVGDFFGDAIDMPSVLLSSREASVLKLLLQGYTNRWVALNEEELSLL